MQTDLLIAFLKVVEAGSMADAAPLLHCTAPAVSQKIGRLERDLKVSLLIRQPHGVELTPAGKALVNRARQLLGLSSEIEDEIRLIAKRKSRELHIASFSSANISLLPEALKKFRHEYPDVVISLTEVDYAEPYRELLQGNVDLVIGFRYTHVPVPLPVGIKETELGKEPLLVVLPKNHELSKRKNIKLIELKDQPWVFFPPPIVAHISVQKAAEDLGYTPHVQYQTSDYQVIHEWVGAGLGISLLPKMMAAEFNASKIATRPLSGNFLGRSIFVAQRENSSNETLNPMQELLAEVFNSLE